MIDGTGKYLIPGLADMHIHLYVLDQGKELPLFIANGVTTMMDCNGRDHILAFRDEIAATSRAWRSSSRDGFAGRPDLPISLW